jgi:tRNA A37 methylthiotransferase MiaB
MPGQVSAPARRERCRQLAEIEVQLRGDYFRQLVGRRLRVLAESHPHGRPELLTGTACRYAPVELAARGRVAGQLAEVTIGAALEDRLQAAG